MTAKHINQQDKIYFRGAGSSKHLNFDPQFRIQIWSACTDVLRYICNCGYIKTTCTIVLVLKTVYWEFWLYACEK